MSVDFTDDQSTLIQVMTCRQATINYLRQCWPRTMSPYGVTRPQWVNMEMITSYYWGHGDFMTWKCFPHYRPFVRAVTGKLGHCWIPLQKDYIRTDLLFLFAAILISIVEDTTKKAVPWNVLTLNIMVVMTVKYPFRPSSWTKSYLKRNSYISICHLSWMGFDPKYGNGY